jgi:DNA (cytosine-5)-methyltransferase 1
MISGTSISSLSAESTPRARWRHPTFVDLFAGCGGLSLGLMMSGWKGLFAIERNMDAFKTLSHNLIDSAKNNACQRFDWPDWLAKSPLEIKTFIRKYKSHIRALKGQVHLVAGGPPCQGFSFAGKRTGKDPRNELFRHHLQVVDSIRPCLVLMENVLGVNTAFGTKSIRSQIRFGRPRKSYAHRIKEALWEHGYVVQQDLVKAVNFGVPQYRPRYFTLGIRGDLYEGKEYLNFFEILNGVRREFLGNHGLPIRRPISVSEAISDLLTIGKKIIECVDPESPPGFRQIVYNKPITPYQRLMHGHLNGSTPNSLRLVNHRPETVRRFRAILVKCRKGVQISDDDRARLGIKKKSITPLAANLPSPTLTTLPDDLLHYREPRIHTVREHARLQSFPDWFEFRGKYTTGEHRRATDCPRYSQVGNAVPPLLAEAIGEALMILLKNLVGRSR